MRINIRVYAYKNAYIRTYAYTRLFISVYEQGYCLSIALRVIVLKNSLTALKTTRLRTELHEDFSRYAVVSVYELDRNYVLIDINGLSFSNGTFMGRDGFHHLYQHYIHRNGFGMCSK